MILKFTKDYIGRETAMKQYRAGETEDISNAQALELIKLGVAKETWAEIGKMFDGAARAKHDPPSVKAPRKGKVKA